MIIELALYRGIMLWLNGKTSPQSWSCGTEGNTLSCSDLEVDGHKIEKVEVAGPEHDDCDPDKGAFFVFDKALVPETLTLTTDKGTYSGKIDKIVIWDAEAQEMTSVTLENGEKYEIDEITLYLRATLS